MSFSLDFQEQWTSLSDYIVSGLIKSASSSTPAFETAEKLYQNEILRWNMEGQYNAEWLNTLRAADSAAANLFEDKLKNFSFQKVEPANPNSAMNIVGAVAGGVIGAGVGSLLKLGAIVTIGAGIAMAVAGAAIGSKIASEQNEKNADAEIDAYKKQLDELGGQLLTIVRTADGKGPSEA